VQLERKLAHSFAKLRQELHDLLPQESCRESIQRIVLAAPGPEAVRESEKIPFVDRVHHVGDNTLDDLVFQRGDAKRTLRFRPLSQ
jgi:hypothetical protein